MTLKFRDGAHFAALDGGSVTIALATAGRPPHSGPGRRRHQDRRCRCGCAGRRGQRRAIVKGPYDDAHERRAVVYDHQGNGGLLPLAGPLTATA